MPDPAYKLVSLKGGVHAVYSLADAEAFHPAIGPAAEAEELYVRQLRLVDRVAAATGDFVIWDVGLGAAANAVTALRILSREIPSNRTLRVVSFDHTTAAAEFALAHAGRLPYLAGYEAAVGELVRTGTAHWQTGSVEVAWTFKPGDFPELIQSAPSRLPPPHAILFDPHSPAKNPAMWTAGLFENLHRCLDPARPCALATFTRSTLARVAMLLGGFFVGAGHPSGLKEETTVAANRLDLLEEPLNARWLERALRSGSAEPMRTPVYRQSPLTAETAAQLKSHRQFAPDLRFEI
ncbi:MAG: MnmC family methyltransferase [Verrucomicrobiota bacterium]